MEYYTIVGMVMICLIALGGIYFTVRANAEKDQKPIHDLNINIVKLSESIDNMKENDSIRDKRIEKHGEEIDMLEKIVDRHEIRLNNLDKCNFKLSERNEKQ